MSISTIRKANKEDENKLNIKAQEFIHRHQLGSNFDEATDWRELEYIINDRYRYGNMIDLWTKIKCRALDVACDKNVVIAYNYVGVCLD
jgi:hypothetical protein